jgi:sigma-E factor negative regulatory protein RseA
MQNDRETISRLMDGEIGNADASMLTRITGDEDARAVWARYHLIGDVVRDSMIEVAPAAFCERVRREISDEPTALAPRRRGYVLRRSVAGLAIAASVATLAVVGVNQMAREQGLNSAPEIAASAPAQTAPVLLAADQQSAEAPVVVDPFQGPPNSPHRLNSYLVKFNEQRSSLAVPGVNPYVRIVGFRAD